MFFVTFVIVNLLSVIFKVSIFVLQFVYPLFGVIVNVAVEPFLIVFLVASDVAFFKVNVTSNSSCSFTHHLAYSVIVPLFLDDKFLTLAPSKYLTSPVADVAHPSNTYPLFLN